MMALTLSFGGLLAAGLLLMLSPWFWPSHRTRPPRNALAQLLHRAGFHRANPSRFVSATTLAGGVVGFAVFALTGVPAIGFVAAGAGAWAPVAVVLWRAERRRLALDTIWPDVIDHLVGALRSGHGLPDALMQLASTGPEQLRSDVIECARVYRLSGSWNAALDALQQRCAHSTADRLCALLRLAREVGGGDIVAVLREFAEHLRHAAAIRSELRARQSWITNAARLGVAAPWIVLIALNLRPEARFAFNTPTGGAIILSGAIVSAVAYVIMKRVGRLPPEPRWVCT